MRSIFSPARWSRRRSAPAVTRRLAAGVAATAVLLGGACGSPPPAGTTPGAPSATPDAFPVTVGNLTLGEQPKRIVSLSPTATEMLFVVGAGAQVVAVDKLSNFPAEAPKSDLDAYKPNAEAIADQDPDLVVLSNDTDKIISQLGALKIPVYLAPAASTIDDTYQQLTDLAALTGHKTEGAEQAQRIRDDIATLTQDVPKRARPLTYYYELDPTYYSVTSQTFIGSLFTQAGLTNIADAGAKGNPYPQLSPEVIIKANPDLIFLADTKCCGQSPQTVAARPGWDKVTAVVKGQVVALDDDIASRWGPRVLNLLRAITEAVNKVPA